MISIKNRSLALVFSAIVISSALLVGLHQFFPAAHATPTAASFGIAGGFGKVSGNTNTRQSLLRLGNTTGLNFFVAVGDLGMGYYFRHEADWCTGFAAQFPNLIIVDGTHDTGHDFAADAVIYDSNSNGIYDTGDTLIYAGAGGSAPALGTSTVSTDSKIKYVDSNSNGHWDAGESSVWDDVLAGKMQSQMPVMTGTIPSVGTTLGADSKIKYFDRNADASYTKPTGNQDFERFVASASCNTTPSSTSGYTYSGINCNTHLPGQVGYVFPTCYGREYYFDCCTPNAQVRIIIASPGIQNITGVGAGFGVNTWDYQVGDAHYNWVQSAIQGAYTVGLQPIVITADVCGSLLTEECGEGFHHFVSYDSSHKLYAGDFMDLITATGATIWVGASDFGYERMKQLTSIGCSFTETSTTYDVAAIHAVKDLCNHIASQSSPSVYNIGAGIIPVISAAFGQGLRNGNMSGEPIIQDANSNGVYDAGESFIAWPPPTAGATLTGPISGNPTYIHFNDVNNNGVWDPATDTLYFDGNHNGAFDPGETIIEGPYDVWDYALHPVNGTQFKITDSNSNGKWDIQVNGQTNPHDALLGQGVYGGTQGGYFATFMGKNSPCNGSTCNGHGWLQIDLSTAGGLSGTTHICRDGEFPTSNYSQCINSAVYSDTFNLNKANVPADDWTSHASNPAVNYTTLPESQPKVLINPNTLTRGAVQIIDNYSFNYAVTPYFMTRNYPTMTQLTDGGIGQCFQGTASSLNLYQAQFRLSKVGSPTGKGYAALFAVSGTPPNCAPASLTPIVLSASLDISTISTSATRYTFTFAPGTLISNIWYAIAFYGTGGTLDSSNYVDVYADQTTEIDRMQKLFVALLTESQP